MKKSELRALTPEEISAKVQEKKEALFNLRFQHGIGQLENTTLLKSTKREIARLKTIEREKQRK